MARGLECCRECRPNGWKSKVHHRRMGMRAFVVAAGLILVGCQSETIDNSMIVEPDLPVSYSQDVQPIFMSSCSGSGCHINSTTNGVRLSSYQAVITSRGVRYGRLIVEPGRPAESPIVDKINANPEFGVRMPNGRSSLSGQDIGLIMKWIEDGAKDN